MMYKKIGRPIETPKRTRIRIMELMSDGRERLQAEITEKLEISHTTGRTHLNQLVKMGMLKRYTICGLRAYQLEVQP